MRGMPADLLSGETWLLKIIAHVDGASRGNPGPAGYGAYLRVDNGDIIEACGFLGRTTNNVAEYAGLLEALSLAQQEGAREVEIISDSLLLVNQMLGLYRVKHENLRPLFLKAISMARTFDRFSIRHTLRAGNKDADRLANRAVDRGEGKEVQRTHDDGI